MTEPDDWANIRRRIDEAGFAASARPAIDWFCRTSLAERDRRAAALCKAGWE